MSYMVVTNIPLNDEMVKDVRVFDDIKLAKYYKWKQDTEYYQAQIYEL